VRIQISEPVSRKLTEKHGGVSADEILQCFENRTGRLLIETRPEHKTNPPTKWFISETNRGRKLKIAYMSTQDADGLRAEIKSAYEPSRQTIEFYEANAR
jgi:hypothetical protein